MEQKMHEANLNGERTVIKTGAYVMVSLVNGSVATPAEGTLRRTVYGGGLRGTIARFLDKRSVRREAFDVVTFAHHIVDVHQVGQEDLKSLPQGLTDTDQVRLANIVAQISLQHGYMQSDLRQKSDVKPPYKLGRILADFLDVIPRSVAARLVFACANPDVAQTIKRGEGTLNISDVDVQSLIIEGLILTLPQTRREIFTELAKLQAEKDGRANRLLSLITSNWVNRNSDYCGPTMIYRNLEDQQASSKVLEVQTEFADLRQITSLPST